MKHEIELKAVEVVRLPLPLVTRKEDMANAARNIAAAEARMAAQKRADEVDRRQPYCTASRSDFVIENVVTAVLGASIVGSAATVIGLLF